MTGRGTIDSPWDLRKALNWSGADGGSTLYLRGGTYVGVFDVVMPGLTVRSYPGEMATIEGRLTVSGEEATVRDLVIAGTATDRTVDPGEGLSLTGRGAKAIGCVIHDHGVAIGSYQANGAGVEVADCITYNQGWQLDTVDRGHGHSIYIQNGTGVIKRVRRNIFGPGYGWNVHCYSASQKMEDIDWEANIAALGGLLANEDDNFATLRYGSIIGGGGTVNRHQIARHYGYESLWDLDYLTSGQSGLDLSGVIRGTTGKASWSGLTDTSTSPSTDAVYVEPSDYEDGRANIAVYNSALANTVDVDLSSVLDNGDTFGIFDGFNPLGGALVTGTYSGPVTITMPTTFAVPVGGWRWGSAPTRSKAFGAFVVRKVTTWVAPA